MNNLDVKSLTDTQLATCVDEYVKRTMLAGRTRHEDMQNEYIGVTVTASQGNADAEYAIEHKVNIGWGTGQNVVGNNCIRGVVLATDRFCNDKAIGPTKVQPLLAAPLSDPNMSDAEFFEVVEDRSDDVPFN
jgi:hypothetical protein